jgi:hypothetical protein
VVVSIDTLILFLLKRRFEGEEMMGVGESVDLV